MIEIIYEYKGSIMHMKYENRDIFLTSQLACTLDVPSFYTVLKVIVDQHEIKDLANVKQDDVYHYFLKQKQKN